MVPKKRLGQHFLKNKQAIRDIVDGLNLNERDIVIEIGPGHGEFTQEIISRGKNTTVIAIEKDKALIPVLSKKFGRKIEIVSGDALRVLPSILDEKGFLDGGYKIIGNIPYYITGYLLRVIGELKNKPSITVFTIQKEVALRLCSRAPSMNLLSASVRVWGTPSLLHILPKSDFFPIPKVDSAVVSIKTRDLNISQGYYRVIKVIFRQPRKTVLNNLSIISSKNRVLEILNQLMIPVTARPQNLDEAMLRKLCEIVYNEMGKCLKT